MIPTVPPFDVIATVISTELTTLDFLIERNCLYVSTACRLCGSRLSLRRDKQLLRCVGHTCRQQFSIRQGSFFARSKLPLRKIVLFGYAWLLKMPQTSIASFVGCSSATATAFSGHYRQLVADSLEPEDFVVGGQGIVVEVDECKLGKRKYDRGHPVEGVWVLGGVEKTPERRVFLIPVPDRSAETLLNILSRHVEPGTIIMTDLRRGYFGLAERLGLEHRTVNHSETFVNPVDGTCTNTIEGTWNGLKLSITPRKRTKDFFEDCLWEFIWRRKNSADLFGGLLRAFSEIDYCQ